MGEINKVRLQVNVEGYVQGVGFRMYTRDIAQKMGLTGWVRNRTNGVVEVVAEGERKDLNLFLRYLWKGPRSSVVTNVETQWGPYTGEFSQFAIAPSAY